MKRNQFIGIAVVVVMLLGANDLAAAKASKSSFLTLRAGSNMFQSCGSGGDYVAGENDFPVTPAHQGAALGIGLTFSNPKSLAFGVSVSYGLSSAIDLRDPSDGETVTVDSPTSLQAVLNLSKFIDLSQKLRLVIFLGGGGEYRLADGREFVSSLGNKIVVESPAKPFSPLAAAGVGLHCMLSNALGLALEIQGAYIFRDPAQLLLTPALGLILKL